MPFIDESAIAGSSIALITPFGTRRFTHAIHDIDGTHSLIRDWPPVMSLSMHYAMTCGLADGFDAEARAQELVEQIGRAECREREKM